jgi:hypothetical protein
LCLKATGASPNLELAWNNAHKLLIKAQDIFWYQTKIVLFDYIFPQCGQLDKKTCQALHSHHFQLDLNASDISAFEGINFSQIGVTPNSYSAIQPYIFHFTRESFANVCALGHFSISAYSFVL